MHPTAALLTVCGVLMQARWAAAGAQGGVQPDVGSQPNQQLSCGSLSWTLQQELPRPECYGNFNGCYNLNMRRQVLDNSDNKTVPCGFMAASGYDALRQEAATWDCDTIVYTGKFGKVESIHLPPVVPAEAHLGKVCYVVIVDQPSKNYFKLHLAETLGWHVYVVDDMPYPDSVAKSYKVLKILGGQIFPSVQRTLFFDAALTFKQPVLDMFYLIGDDTALLGFTNPNRPERTTMAELYNARRRLLKPNRSSFVDPDAVQRIQMQLRLYAPVMGKSTEIVLQSNVLIRQYGALRGCAQLYECAWMGELDLFSYRDQPATILLRHALGLDEQIDIQPHSVKEVFVAKRESHWPDWWHALNVTSDHVLQQRLTAWSAEEQATYTAAIAPWTQPDGGASAGAGSAADAAAAAAVAGSKAGSAENRNRWRHEQRR